MLRHIAFPPTAEAPDRRRVARPVEMSGHRPMLQKHRPGQPRPMKRLGRVRSCNTTCASSSMPMNAKPDQVYGADDGGEPRRGSSRLSCRTLRMMQRSCDVMTSRLTFLAAAAPRFGRRGCGAGSRASEQYKEDEDNQSRARTVWVRPNAGFCCSAFMKWRAQRAFRDALSAASIVRPATGGRCVGRDHRAMHGHDLRAGLVFARRTVRMPVAAADRLQPPPARFPLL